MGVIKVGVMSLIELLGRLDTRVRTFQGPSGADLFLPSLDRQGRYHRIRTRPSTSTQHYFNCLPYARSHMYISHQHKHERSLSTEFAYLLIDFRVWSPKTMETLII